MLRVDTAAPLSPAVSEHAVAVAGLPAATAHEAAVLLRSAAAVRRCILGTRSGLICSRDCWSHRNSGERMKSVAPFRMALPRIERQTTSHYLMQGIPHGGESQAEAAMFVRYWWQVGPRLIALSFAALAYEHQRESGLSCR